IQMTAHFSVKDQLRVGVFRAASSTIVVLLGLLSAGVACAAELEIEAPIVLIDKTSAKGSAVMYVYNRSRTALTSQRRVAGIHLKDDGMGTEGKVTLGPLSGAGKDVYPITVSPNASVPVRIDVAAFGEPGPATAQLLADGVPVGDITAVRSEVPFAV